MASPKRLQTETANVQPAPVSTPLHGEELLNNPVHNKGTAFSAEERKKYGLEGLLPAAVEGLSRQVVRALTHLDAKQSDLERYIYLIALSDQNETLFYRTVMSDPSRFIPILYDPTVADACLAFSPAPGAATTAAGDSWSAPREQWERLALLGCMVNRPLLGVLPPRTLRRQSAAQLPSQRTSVCPRHSGIRFTARPRSAPRPPRVSSSAPAGDAHRRTSSPRPRPRRHPGQ